MGIAKHLNILDYTLQSLQRRKFKNAGIVLVFTLVIFTLASVLFLSYSFKREAVLLLEDSPELIVQKTMAGRHELIPVEMARAIEKIPGVSMVRPRYWGYYFDSLVGANYTVLSSAGGIKDTNRLLEGRLPGPDDTGTVAIGRGIAHARFVGIGGEVTMFSASSAPVSLRVVGVFDTASQLLTSDLIVIGQKDFAELFRMPKDMATDLVVSVPHEAEAPVIARKIHERFPSTRPILRSEIIRTYDAVFGWRSGLVLTIFAGALLAFIILAWDKATGLSAEERKEIGILKAIGWETSDILEMKFWEGMVISLSSFLAGVILAYFHVFFFGASVFAPALKGWSVLYPKFRLVPYVDPYQLATLIMLTVIPYVASTIIPSWKAAITPPDEVVRG